MKNLLFSFVFTLLSTSIFAQVPVNDECSKAIPLTIPQTAGL